MVRFCFLAGIAVFVLSSGLLAARDWVKWDHCEYFEGPHSDGDSIEILGEANATFSDYTSSIAWKRIRPPRRGGPSRGSILA